MSASVSLSRGGQPSTTTPTPPPWDSPHVVMRNNCPKLFAMRGVWGKNGARSNREWRMPPACDGDGAPPVCRRRLALMSDRQARGVATQSQAESLCHYLRARANTSAVFRSEEHTSELQSR